MTAFASRLPVIIVPGLGGSDAGHWQSRFQADLHRTIRLSGVDWDRPNLPLWTDRLLRSVNQQPGSILVAHSLGCALVAHVATRYRDLPVAGAMLVAPADIDASSAIPSSLDSFSGVPRDRLAFPSVVVASIDDPYMTAERAEIFASGWGAQFINIGACGHINIASGFGPWPEGLRILRDFDVRLTAPSHLRPRSHHQERT